MSADDAVRVANLLGSIVLFIGALRSQRWTKKQAATLEDAARNAPGATGDAVDPVPTPEPLPRATRVPGRPALAKPGAFEAGAAKVGAQPYFDRPAYWLFCIGFAITTLASGIDLYSHHMFSRLRGASAVETTCLCVPPAQAAQDKERGPH